MKATRPGRNVQPTPGAWMKRLLVQLAARAEHDARHIPVWPGTSIHSLRKRIKKLSALLRLASPCIEPSALATLRTALRDIKHSVAAQRDSDVMAELMHKFGIPFPHRPPAPVDGEEVLALIREARRMLANLDLATPDWEFVARRYTKAYENARKAWKMARKEPRPTTLHQWRKKVKEHYYHSLALDRWMKQPRHLSRVRRLGSLLGSCHDVDVFAASLTMDGKEVDEDLRARLNARRAKLTKRIFHRAEKVFARPVSATERRVSRALPRTKPPGKPAQSRAVT